MNGLPEAKRAYRNELQLNECYISVAIYLNLISTIKQTNQNQLLSFFDHSKFRSFVKNDSTTENCQSSGCFWLLKLQNQLSGGCSVKNVILKYFVEFRDLQLFLKTKLRHRHFPVNFANFSEELFRRISANVCIWNYFIRLRATACRISQNLAIRKL